MKAFRKFDAAVQSLIFLTVIIIMVCSSPFFIYYGMFFIGAWQLLSAIVNTAGIRQLGDRFRRNIKLYWVFVAVYFVGLLLVPMLVKGNWELEYLVRAWFFSALLIAVYYYVLSLQLISDSGREEQTV